MTESGIPIDIHASKLLEWLISRKHCPKNWKMLLDKIREKISVAIKDMPENDDIQKILSKHTFNYIICNRLFDILKETEKYSKNVFGYYSSQRIKDWQEIIQLYKKDGVYLAELAQILLRNVTYEVSNIKKTISRMQQLHDEYDRKSDDYLKQSQSLKKDYSKLADSHGLKGENIKNELKDLLKEFPVVLSTFENFLINIEECKNQYFLFLEKFNQSSRDDILPMLNYFLYKGNTTYFEYRTGQKPEVIQQTEFIIEKQKNIQEDEIDFNDEIDFGDLDNPNDEIEILNSNTNENVSDKNLIAKDDDALTILEHILTRSLLLNELKELEGFFEQRILDCKSEESTLFSNYLEENSDLIDLFNLDSLENLLLKVKKIFEFLNRDKIQMLFLLKSEKKFVETIIHKFNHKLQLVERSIKKAESMNQSAKRCIKTIENIKPQIPVITNQTKEIQKLLQNEISMFYKNRPVNIMGGVQIL